jgi:23S rRNA U2552 (ribose-2'-O)-methylase RlmE/FtsJ
MRRISLLAAAIAVIALSVAPGASAKSQSKTCSTSSKNVIGKSVKATLIANNVNSVQARYATCGQAKKAMNQLLSLRIEEPKSVAGYYCTPTVHSTGPDVVSYKCLFRGADTPMFVKVTFKVTYDQD